ncbi:MAG: hypothetical protein P1P86_15410 [Bacteroidales bacterium]|nr:hypothetical protein [Bacteroidales bacterium]
MKELLDAYCKRLYPEIKEVTVKPLPLLKIIAFLTRNKKLKFAASLFAYFEKVKEPDIPEPNLVRLGKAETDFNTWITSKYSEK